MRVENFGQSIMAWAGGTEHLEQSAGRHVHLAAGMNVVCSCDGRWEAGPGWSGWSRVLVLGIRGHSGQAGPKCMPGVISQEEEFKLAMK